MWLPAERALVWIVPTQKLIDSFSDNSPVNPLVPVALIVSVCLICTDTGGKKFAAAFFLHHHTFLPITCVYVHANNGNYKNDEESKDIAW